MKHRSFTCDGGCGLIRTFRAKLVPFECTGCGRCQGWQRLRDAPPQKGMVKEIVTGLVGRWESMRQRLPTKFETAGSRISHPAPYKRRMMRELIDMQAEGQRLQDLLWQERARMEDAYARQAIEAAKEKLLRRHLPIERRTGAEDSSPQPERKEGKFISLSGLRARHWSPKMITTFLGEPDKLATNPHYASAPRMRLYERHRVENAEQTADWLAAKQKLAERRQNRRSNPLTRSANSIE